MEIFTVPVQYQISMTQQTQVIINYNNNRWQECEIFSENIQHCNISMSKILRAQPARANQLFFGAHRLQTFNYLNYTIIKNTLRTFVIKVIIKWQNLKVYPLWLLKCLKKLLKNICKYTTKTSLKSLGYICSNSQKYIVWVKMIYLSFMPKIIRILSKDHVPWRYFVNFLW